MVSMPFDMGNLIGAIAETATHCGAIRCLSDKPINRKNTISAESLSDNQSQQSSALPAQSHRTYSHVNESAKKECT